MKIITIIPSPTYTIAHLMIPIMAAKLSAKPMTCLLTFARHPLYPLSFIPFPFLIRIGRAYWKELIGYGISTCHSDYDSFALNPPRFEYFMFYYRA